MGLTINGSSLIVKRYLTVKDWGVIFMETAALGGKRKFQFGQIDYVLISPTNVLSFQVGQEVFQIPTKPGKVKHQQVIQQLLESVSRSQQMTGGFPINPGVRRA
jgi:hypothetical protein